MNDTIVRSLTYLVRKLKESVALKDNFGCKKGQEKKRSAADIHRLTSFTG